MSDTQYLSRDKYTELEKELVTIKHETIPEIAKRIDEAKQMGDLSENAEYNDARDQMAWAQSRMKEIESILQSAQIISDDDLKFGVVGIGSTIVVEVAGREKEFTIVGAQEADPLIGKISNESPLGEAFLGRKKGETVEVEVPAGVQKYTLLTIK
ncbi:MAG: transcription elongation factor GreA [Candidatus Magasanikbacteria bacterium CG_4_10_14_0_2_um_filter_37_12]|uniref:Transcription elongation factor GreA n=1 Tax=Candidatus Magasanikbacteria bacterium CG_4_10_14_0_2_um_filter_37_12 TaxID=1974637 RepID=A0A2M7V7D8_9BACT|nr:MAG: transcription elongation factor GreA [Candidatus Magasanikbacteria bacterium CG_4_10_14_0_2_um_filter_37_12]